MVPKIGSGTDWSDEDKSVVDGSHMDGVPGRLSAAGACLPDFARFTIFLFNLTLSIHPPNIADQPASLWRHPNGPRLFHAKRLNSLIESEADPLRRLVASSVCCVGLWSAIRVVGRRAHNQSQLPDLLARA